MLVLTRSSDKSLSRVHSCLASLQNVGTSTDPGRRLGIESLTATYRAHLVRRYQHTMKNFEDQQVNASREAHRPKFECARWQLFVCGRGPFASCIHIFFGTAEKSALILIQRQGTHIFGIWAEPAAQRASLVMVVQKMRLNKSQQLDPGHSASSPLLQSPLSCGHSHV